MNPTFIRASNGSFGLLVIHHHHHLGHLGLLLPVGPFPDGTIAVRCSHLQVWGRVSVASRVQRVNWLHIVHRLQWLCRVYRLQWLHRIQTLWWLCRVYKERFHALYAGSEFALEQIACIIRGDMASFGKSLILDRSVTFLDEQ